MNINNQVNHECSFTSRIAAHIEKEIIMNRVLVASLIIAITCISLLLGGCQPANVAMIVITKGPADNMSIVEKVTLKPVQKNIGGIYAKVVSAKVIGYVKGEGILFDGMVEIDSNNYPAILTRDSETVFDKNRVPEESVNGPYPGESVLVVSINGVYYDNIEGLRIKSPTNQAQ